MTPFNLRDWHYLEGRISTRTIMYITFVVVQSCPSFATSWTVARQAPLSSTISGVWAMSWWCHLTISSSAIPFSFCLQSFPLSGSFPMSVGVLQSMVLQIVGHDWVTEQQTSYQVGNLLELQLQHQYFQLVFRFYFL